MTTTRDAQTVRTACGVRLAPEHILSRSVHAFCRWVDETTLTVWCGITVDLKAGARQTTDLVSCLGCGQASYDAIWGR